MRAPRKGKVGGGGHPRWEPPPLLRFELRQTLGEALGARVEHECLAAVVVGVAAVLRDEGGKRLVHGHLVERHRHLVAFTPCRIHEIEGGGEFGLDYCPLPLVLDELRVEARGNIPQARAATPELRRPCPQALDDAVLDAAGEHVISVACGVRFESARMLIGFA